MHDDLIDAVNWAIAERIADPAHIAIAGYSYGGYAPFVGATFTPDVSCCSVPVVGITNLETILANPPAKRRMELRSPPASVARALEPVA
jgi:dipeptidyl aminopeptidase/acylaminoacyl peptidase